MAYMTDTGRTATVMNYWYSGSATAPPAPSLPFTLRLMTAMGAGNGNVSGSDGTQATSTNCPGYTAGGSSLGSSPVFSAMSATSPGPMSNSSAVTWTATGTWAEIVGLEIWDSTPLRWVQGTLTSPVSGIASGDTVQFAAGSVVLNAAGW